MKKILTFVLIIIGIIIGVNVVFWIFNICPPHGPWPTPPWCQTLEPIRQPKIGYLDDLGCFPKDCAGLPKGVKELCQAYRDNNISWPASCQDFRETACQKLCQRSKDEAQKKLAALEAAKKFTPAQLPYLNDTFAKTSHPLILAVGLHDIWGNICYAKDLWQGCEDSATHMTSALERIKNIGGQMVMVTDFSALNKDLTIVRPNPLSGAHEINQADLNKITTTAKNNGQKTMLFTNLYDNEDNARNQVNFQTTDAEIVNKLFAGWKNIILANAQKAKNAGIDYLVINARDIQLDWFGYQKPLLNQQYSDILTEIRKNYQGKVCYSNNLGELADPNLSFIKKLDCVIEDSGISNILKNAAINVDSMENAWAAHLSNKEFNNFPDQQVFVMALIPSYQNAVHQGWIEPGIGYPLGTYTRDWQEQALAYEALFRAIYHNRAKHVDGIISYGYWWTDTIHPDEKMANGLGQSIRGKDAEQVFYYWSNIFNH